MHTSKRFGDYTFKELYMNYFEGLYRFAWHYVMCEEARDLVQDVFIHLYENRDKLPDDTKWLGYLLTATKNRCMNFLRRKDIIDRHENRLVEAIISWNHECPESHEELTAGIERCMQLLSPQQQMVIRLKTEGKTYQEIADLMKINIGTVNTHINRAYTVFRDNFESSLLLIYFISRFL